VHSREKRLFEDAQVEELLKKGIITNSKSPWAAPTVIVRNNNGDSRLCMDYRGLNKVTVGDAYPIPRIHHLINKPFKATCFSKIDINKAYWTCIVDPKDKHKTAFITTKGLYEWERMPFGLKNAPAFWQRSMDTLLNKVANCAVYFDDILVFSDTEEQHIQDVDKILTTLQAMGTTSKRAKCVFGVKRIRFLGHVLSEKGIEPDDTKVQAVRDWKIPDSMAELKTFLGFARHYCQYVENFTKLAHPLQQVLNKKMNVREAFLNPEIRQAFDNIKHALCNRPILAMPDFSREFTIYCDASEKGLGIVLTQMFEDGEHPIAYGSRVLRDAERNYSTIELEGLAVIWAIKDKFRQYISPNVHFTVVTDHHPIAFMMRTRENHAERLAKWSTILQGYNFTIIHRKGKENIPADALSRTFPDKDKIPSEEYYELPKQIKEQGKITERFDPHRKYVARAKTQNSVPFEKQHIIATVQTEEHAREQIAKAEAEIAMEQTRHEKILAEVRKLQKEESELKVIFKNLAVNDAEITMLNNKRKEEVSKHKQNYVIANDFLYHVDKNKDTNLPVNQLVIPVTMKNFVLYQYHDSPLGGCHFGILKTYRKILSRYYWKGIQRDIIEYILNCKECIKVKNRDASLYVPGQGRVPAKGPLHTIMMDFLGPFPKTIGNKLYILVVVCQFTRYVWAIPTKTRSATEVADILLSQVFAPFGFPEIIVSDNAHEFTGSVMTCLYAQLRIHKVNTTFYHPQGNALPERVNQPILKALTFYANEHKTNWDLFVPCFVCSYNGAVHVTTKLTPFFAMFGREIRYPYDMITGPIESDKYINSNDYSVDLEIAMEHSHKMINNANLLQAKDYEEATNNPSKKLMIFNVGALVMYQAQPTIEYRMTEDEKKKRAKIRKMNQEYHTDHRLPTIAKSGKAKLAAQWYGPYVVKEKIAKNVYRLRAIRDDIAQKKNNDFNANAARLKPCRDDHGQDIRSEHWAIGSLRECIKREKEKLKQIPIEARSLQFRDGQWYLIKDQNEILELNAPNDMDNMELQGTTTPPEEGYDTEDEKESKDSNTQDMNISSDNEGLSQDNTTDESEEEDEPTQTPLNDFSLDQQRTIVEHDSMMDDAQLQSNPDIIKANLETRGKTPSRLLDKTIDDVELRGRHNPPRMKKSNQVYTPDDFRIKYKRI
jgi:hypothetical protein